MEQKPKKRGRKPKGTVQNKTSLNKVEHDIIIHLPIKNKTSIDLKMCEPIEKKIKKITKKQIIHTYEVKINEGVQCWWCRHCFTLPKVELPYKYFENKFYCYGNFCSYECCEAYNVDLNDENVTNRSSLLKFHHYKTYGFFKCITQANDWKIIKGLGGHIEIEQFRQNSTNHNDDYLFLKPPMITRYGHIEKINMIIPNTKITELVLKRSKPLKREKYTLKKLIGITNNC
jgi:hypothetical protein